MARQVFTFLADNFPQPRTNLRVVDIVVVDPLFLTRVVRRVDVDAVYAPLVLRQERFQRKEIVPVDNHVPAVITVIMLAGCIEHVLPLQHMIRHVKMMIHDLALPNPLQLRHNGTPFLVSYVSIIEEMERGVKAAKKG